MKKHKFNQIGSLWGLVLILLFAAAPIASSQPDPPREEESQQKPVLVGRISHVEGQLLRYIPSEKDWVATREDAPFGLDDALYSNEKGKAEFIMPNNTWVRIDGDTQIQMIRMEEDLTEMDLASGTARFYNKSSTGLIKATTPFGYVVAGPQTTFDLCVGDESAEVIALNGKVDFVHPSGEAKYEVAAGSSSLLADGQQISSGEGRPDADWDEWNSTRQSLWAKRLQAPGPSKKYLPPSLEDEAWALEESGTWERVYYEGSYRHFWRPIHVAPGWAPFTVGRWTDWYGDQCWIPDEPFGYLTHHYGNWVFAGGLWYWAPPVVSVGIGMGLPLPPLPLLPIPFAWFPGRVSWIHSDLYIGWVLLAPFEPYYCHHRWGPHILVVHHTRPIHVNPGHYRYFNHAVAVRQHDFHTVNNYTRARIGKIDKITLMKDYRGAPVVNDMVIKDYTKDKQKYRFTNVEVSEKPHQTVLNRIQHNELRARQEGKERENAGRIQQEIEKFKRGEPVPGARIEEPKVSRKLVPGKETNRPETEIRFPEKPIKERGEAKPGIEQPIRPAKPEQPSEPERKIRPPRPGQSGAVQPKKLEGREATKGRIAPPARPARSRDMYTVQPGSARQRELKGPVQARRGVPGQKPSGPEQQLQYRPQGQPGPQGQWDRRAQRRDEERQQYRVSQGQRGQRDPRPQSQRGPGEQQPRARTQWQPEKEGRSN